MPYQNEFLKVNKNLKKISMTPSEIAANDEVENINTVTQPVDVETLDDLPVDQSLDSINDSLNLLQGQTSTTSMRSQSLKLKKGRSSGVLTPFRLIASAMDSMSDQQTHSDHQNTEAQLVFTSEQPSAASVRVTAPTQLEPESKHVESVYVNLPEILIYDEELQSLETFNSDLDNLVINQEKKVYKEIFEVPTKDEIIVSDSRENDFHTNNSSPESNESIQKFKDENEEVAIRKIKAEDEQYYILATPKPLENLAKSESSYSNMTIQSIKLSEFNIQRSTSNVQIMPELHDTNMKFVKVAHNTYKLENPSKTPLNAEDMRHFNYKFKAKLPVILEVSCKLGATAIIEHTIKDGIVEFQIKTSKPKFKISA